MPQRHRVTLVLRGEGPAEGFHIRRLVSRWLEGGTRDGRHHDPLKPFTVTPLQRRPGSDIHTIEVGLLDDALEDRLLERVEDDAKGVTVGPLTGAVAMTRVGEPTQVLDRAAWEDLAALGSDTHDIELHFLSPTVFTQGKRPVLEASVPRVFGHLRRRWHHFGAETEPFISFQNCAARLIEHPRRTAIVRELHRSWPGLLGRVRFDLSPCSPEHRSALNTLAGLVTFAGVGAHTTLGMGVTRRGGGSTAAAE